MNKEWFPWLFFILLFFFGIGIVVYVLNKQQQEQEEEKPLPDWASGIVAIIPALESLFKTFGDFLKTVFDVFKPQGEQSRTGDTYDYA